MEKQIKRLTTLAEKCGKLRHNADGQTAKGMSITFYGGVPWRYRSYAVMFGNVEIGFYSTGPEITFPISTTVDNLKDICEDVTEFLSHLPKRDQK